MTGKLLPLVWNILMESMIICFSLMKQGFLQYKTIIKIIDGFQ